MKQRNNQIIVQGLETCKRLTDFLLEYSIGFSVKCIFGVAHKKMFTITNYNHYRKDWVFEQIKEKTGE